jgi:Icc-related predicted phosphoesterase
MIFISDVHYQLDHLNSLPKNKGPVVILGDLINWIDYRDGQGIAMDVFGKDNVKKLVNLRKEHRFDERKSLWNELYQSDPDKISKKMQDAILKQYEDVFGVLKNYEVWFIPGNVDDVNIMNTYTSNSIKNVDGLIMEYNNKKIGFAGGGVPTPINARGEIDEDTFSKTLSTLKEAEIICTHAPPLVDELVTDVITNKIEQGWLSLKDFIEKHQPQFSLFGDVHQPQASNWVIKATKCINVGYFRATNHYLELSSIYI